MEEKGTWGNLNKEDLLVGQGGPCTKRLDVDSRGN